MEAKDEARRASPYVSHRPYSRKPHRQTGSSRHGGGATGWFVGVGPLTGPAQGHSPSFFNRRLSQGMLCENWAPLEKLGAAHRQADYEIFIDPNGDKMLT